MHGTREGQLMARVYDALKRIEAERSRESLARKTVPVPAPTPPESTSMWKRWFGRQPGVNTASSTPPHTDDLLLERIRVIVNRLDALETRSAAPLPDLDERFRHFDEKLVRLERDLANRMSDVGDHFARSTAQLNARLWALCGLAGAVLLALLFRLW